MAVAQAPAAPMGGGYPVQLTLTDEREINRLWGIPFVGVFVRMILAIPHMIVLGIMSIGLYIWLCWDGSQSCCWVASRRWSSSS